MSKLSSRSSSWLKLGYANTASLVSTTILCIAAMSNVATAARTANQASIDSPARLQWEANYGYCGEVSLISAGLRYGQYLSQYEARDIASNSTKQFKEGSQLLLGVNDMYAASQMHLKASEWDNSDGPDAAAFLAWVKNGIRANSSVIIAVYTNEYTFYGKTKPSAGDNAYDHIVPVMAVSSDNVTFSDNGLYTPNGKPIYIYDYSDGSFPRSRKQANEKDAPPYSLPDKVKNYGLTVSGVIDHDGETLPVHIATNKNYEHPSMKDGSNKRPAPEKLTLTITVDGIQSGQKYNLYRYDSFSDVPNSSFNAKHSQATKSWQINTTSGSTYTLTETIQSDETRIYRAVPASAP